jgi:hypothetical protein
MKIRLLFDFANEAKLPQLAREFEHVRSVVVSLDDDTPLLAVSETAPNQVMVLSWDDQDFETLLRDLGLNQAVIVRRKTVAST